MRGSLFVALTIASAFIGSAATTLILHSRVSPALAQDAPDSPKGEEPKPAPDKVKDGGSEDLAPWKPSKIVTAEEFRLTDSEGKLRAKMGFNDAGYPVFSLFDSKGTEYPQGGNMQAKEVRVKLEAEVARLMALEEHTDGAVEVQHILIGFSGSLPGKTITRSRDEAALLAWEIYNKVKDGGDMGSLVTAHTDDQAPGIYKMALKQEGAAPGVYARTGMVSCFGDIGWRLKVGEVGITDFNSKTGPYGYHIIKRLK
jgi:hypothetical protein